MQTALYRTAQNSKRLSTSVKHSYTRRVKGRRQEISSFGCVRGVHTLTKRAAHKSGERRVTFDGLLSLHFKLPHSLSCYLACSRSQRAGFLHRWQQKRSRSRSHTRPRAIHFLPQRQPLLHRISATFFQNLSTRMDGLTLVVSELLFLIRTSTFP